MFHDISIYIWYYKIDLKTRKKLYKPREARNILKIKIYFRIKYIKKNVYNTRFLNLYQYDW